MLEKAFFEFVVSLLEVRKNLNVEQRERLLRYLVEMLNHFWSIMDQMEE